MRHLNAQHAETQQIGVVAAHALDEIHSAIYGQAHEASRAWTDGDAILLVARLPAIPEPESSATPMTAIQRMVSAAVFRRTGVMLRTGGTNVDVERGLAVLAFERIAAPDDPEDYEPASAGPVADAAD
jgi:hypothetical protein